MELKLTVKEDLFFFELVKHVFAFFFYHNSEKVKGLMSSKEKILTKACVILKNILFFLVLHSAHTF